MLTRLNDAPVDGAVMDCTYDVCIPTAELVPWIEGDEVVARLTEVVALAAEADPLVEFVETRMVSPTSITFRYRTASRNRRPPSAVVYRVVNAVSRSFTDDPPAGIDPGTFRRGCLSRDYRCRSVGAGIRCLPAEYSRR